MRTDWNFEKGLAMQKQGDENREVQRRSSLWVLMSYSFLAGLFWRKEKSGIIESRKLRASGEERRTKVGREGGDNGRCD